MKIVITGASGMIGRALRADFQRDGHTVTRLVRRAPAEPDERRWDPAGGADPELVSGADLVINLAGAGLADRRWSADYKRQVMDSRVRSARTLAEMITAAEHPPGRLLAMSGIRYYGVDRGDTELDEDAEPGHDGFLPEVTHAWDRETEGLPIPVSRLRVGLVLSRQGGLLPPLLSQFRFGLGGPLGSGREFWSCVTLTDVVRAVRFLAELPGAGGPYNVVAPSPARSGDFARELAAALHRPAVLRYPTPLLRLLMGQMATEVLASLRVVPRRLLDAGFRFEHPDLPTSVRHALGDG